MIKRYAKLIAMISVLLIGCNSDINSFCESEQQKFSIRNKREFIIDSQLMADLKARRFITSSHQLFDTTIGAPVYLYSWQERNDSTREFTVIRDERKPEHGLVLYYYILDANDGLLSWKRIAETGTESIFRFEIQSRFLNIDTLVTISSITQWYDLKHNRKMIPTRGDTTFKYLIISKDGWITDTLFREVKALNFPNSYLNS
ncbi:hypothetical protein ACLOAU_16415 [Niabella sp. CJ426]|uniref:hypothetical protein n=1 Tax=Niabella sp. CJ426 TaxID=3393740 RepID=UPI003CFE51D8